MAGAAQRGCVGQFLAAVRAAEHEAATAHVAAAYELRGKEKPLSEDCEERLQIFRCCQAAQQDVVASGTGGLVEKTGVPFEGRPVAGVGDIDAHLRDGLELFEGHDGVGWKQPETGGDDERRRDPGRRVGEGFRVRELASKIQTAYEGIDVAEVGAFGAEFDGKGEAGALVEHHFGPLAAGMGRRKQEDAGHGVQRSAAGTVRCYAERVARAAAAGLTLVLAVQAYGAEFAKWWPQFQASVAKGDAKAVAEGARFPMDWENGPIRQIKTGADFVKHFETYFTPEIRKAIGTGKPGPLAPGEYGVTWKARGNEYTMFFRPVGSGYALGGLSEGPP